MLRHRARTAVPLTAAVAALCLAACQGGTPGAAGPVPSPAAARITTTATTTTTAPPVSSVAPTTAVPAGHGQVVVLDPGHNGGNAAHPAEINKPVPAGRGQTKACNTTGTSTASGYTEHAFNWAVAAIVRSDLVARGYQVVLTRPDDNGVGPCVDARAAIGNQAQAAAVVSIHGDGSMSPGAHGFHVEFSNPPLNAEQGQPAYRLATVLRDTVRAAGFSTSTYLGTAGLLGRADLGGLNLSERPAALIECGNMRDPGDAAVLTSAGGQNRIADAIAAAIATYLGG